MVIELNAEEIKEAKEFIDRVAELGLSWVVEIDGWIRTGDVRMHGTIRCFPTQAMYAADTEGVIEPVHRMRVARPDDITAHYSSRVSERVWRSIIRAEYNITNYDPELREYMISALKARIT